MRLPRAVSPPSGPAWPTPSGRTRIRSAAAVRCWNLHRSKARSQAPDPCLSGLADVAERVLRLGQAVQRDGHGDVGLIPSSSAAARPTGHVFAASLMCPPASMPGLQRPQRRASRRPPRYVEQQGDCRAPIRPATCFPVFATRFASHPLEGRPAATRPGLDHVAQTWRRHRHPHPGPKVARRFPLLVTERERAGSRGVTGQRRTTPFASKSADVHVDIEIRPLSCAIGQTGLRRTRSPGGKDGGNERHPPTRQIQGSRSMLMFSPTLFTHMVAAPSKRCP